MPSLQVSTFSVPLVRVKTFLFVSPLPARPHSLKSRDDKEETHPNAPLHIAVIAIHVLADKVRAGVRLRIICQPVSGNYAQCKREEKTVDQSRFLLLRVQRVTV